MRTNRRTFPAAELRPESLEEPLNLRAVFGREAPLEVDLGCGDGSFLTALAAEFPERNFLGVERMPGRVRSVCRKIGDRQLPNARVVQVEILTALSSLLPAESAAVCHLLFSDPWPKRRHHSRRVFSAEFLRAVARALIPAGILRVATDHADYFSEMESIWTEMDAFQVESEKTDPVGSSFATTFEKRFHANGARIHRALLRKRCLPHHSVETRMALP